MMMMMNKIIEMIKIINYLYLYIIYYIRANTCCPMGGLYLSTITPDINLEYKVLRETSAE